MKLSRKYDDVTVGNASGSNDSSSSTGRSAVAVFIASFLAALGFQAGNATSDGIKSLFKGDK